MLPLLRLALLTMPLLLVASHPGHHPEAPFARDGVLFVGGEPLIPAGVYF